MPGSRWSLVCLIWHFCKVLFLLFSLLFQQWCWQTELQLQPILLAILSVLLQQQQPWCRLTVRALAPTPQPRAHLPGQAYYGRNLRQMGEQIQKCTWHKEQILTPNANNNLILSLLHFKFGSRVQRKDSAVTSPYCSCRRPGVSSQHPHSIHSHSHLEPQFRDLMPSSRHQACTWYTYVCAGKTLINIIF